MKKQYYVLFFVLLIISAMIIGLSACQSGKPSSAESSETAGASGTSGTSGTSGDSASEAPTSEVSTSDADSGIKDGSNDPELKTFTLEELAEYDGKNGNPAYIAIEGKVYDVSKVPQWQEGIHAGKFQAGKDYTKELKQTAPHSASKMDDIPVIGTLAE